MWGLSQSRQIQSNHALSATFGDWPLRSRVHERVTEIT